MKRNVFIRLALLLFSAVLLLALVSCDPEEPEEPVTPPEQTVENPPEEPVAETTAVVYVNAEGYAGATSFPTGEGLILGVPEREGADFLGWFADETLTGEPLTAIPAGTAGTVTLYAGWDVYEMTVNYRYHVDGVPDQRLKIAFGTSVTLNAPDVEKSGYTFAGWTVKGVPFATDSVYTFDDESVTTVTFDADWTVNSYNIRYLSDGRKIASESLSFGTEITRVPEQKTGYDFAGWTTDENATEAIPCLTVPAGDTVLYAVWTPKMYDVAVQVNVEGLEIPQLTPGRYAYDTALTLPAEITGYTLRYETVDAEGNHRFFSSSTYLVGRTDGIVGLAVTATPKKVTVTLAGDYGNASRSADFGILLTSLLPSLSAGGDVIVGWYYDEAMTRPVLAGETLCKEGSAAFFAKTGTETNKFVLHRADGTTEDLSLAFGAALTVTDSKTGYTFLGWENADRVPVDTMASVGEDLWPRFSINSYTIRFDTDGGRGLELSPVVAEYGSTLTLPDGEDLLRDYREFGGWEYKGTVYASLAQITVAAGDDVIRAVWNKIPIVAVFYDWDSTVIYTIHSFAGDPITISGDSLIESVTEFDRWVFTDTLGNAGVFVNGETCFPENVYLRAVYCKSVNGVKTDLVYPAKESFAFVATSWKGTGENRVVTTYSISAHYIDTDGNMTDAYLAKMSSDLCIPSTYGGGIVNSIYYKGASETSGAFTTLRNDQPNASWFRSIYIPAAIASIPNYAFYGHNAEVTFGVGSKCYHVGYKAFSYTSYSAGSTRNFYNMPTDLRYIGSYAFYFNVANSNSMWHWYDDAGNAITSLPGTITYIGSCAFMNIGLFDTVYIGPQVTTLGTRAFYGMHTLTSITIAETSELTSIPKECFRGCVGLTEITIPPSVESIGEMAFAMCYNIKAIHFSNGGNLKTIGSRAFYDCREITQLNIPEGVTDIGNAAFTWNYNGKYTSSAPTFYSGYLTPASYVLGKLETLTLPSTLVSIGECAFMYQNIQSLTLPVNLESIGDGAFMVCPGISYLNLSGLSKLTYIGSFAFQRFHGYTSPVNFVLTIPENVETIGDWAFTSFTNISSIVFLGNALTTIGDGAFADITAMKSFDMVLPEGLVEIGSNAFLYTEIRKVSFPGTLEVISLYAFRGNTALTEIRFTENKDSENGLKILNGAFGECTSLITVTLPCQTVRVTGGASRSDYNGAFAGCTSLTTVYINGRGDGGTDRDLMITSSAFYGCSALTDIYIKRNTAAALTLDSDESAISNCAFYGCSPALKVHVIASLKGAYVGDENWKGIFNTLRRATLVDDATL